MDSSSHPTKTSNATDTTTLGQSLNVFASLTDRPTERLTTQSLMRFVMILWVVNLSAGVLFAASIVPLAWLVCWLVRSFICWVCVWSVIYFIPGGHFSVYVSIYFVINDHFRVIHSIEAFYYDVVVVSLEWRKISDDYHMDEIEYGSSS